MTTSKQKLSFFNMIDLKFIYSTFERTHKSQCTAVKKGNPTYRFVKTPFLLIYFGITILKAVDWVAFHVAVTSTIHKACAILRNDYDLLSGKNASHELRDNS